jgi:WhiB family transcriptional regulator, redox-sensing transcriptional regulator
MSVRKQPAPGVAAAIPSVVRHPDIACADVPPDLFFPQYGESADLARRICARCPHQAECLTWALKTKQRFGIWGGKSPMERAVIRRGLARRRRIAGLLGAPS